MTVGFSSLPFDIISNVSSFLFLNDGKMSSLSCLSKEIACTIIASLCSDGRMKSSFLEYFPFKMGYAEKTQAKRNKFNATMGDIEKLPLGTRYLCLKALRIAAHGFGMNPVRPVYPRYFSFLGRSQVPRPIMTRCWEIWIDESDVLANSTVTHRYSISIDSFRSLIQAYKNVMEVRLYDERSIPKYIVHQSGVKCLTEQMRLYILFGIYSDEEVLKRCMERQGKWNLLSHRAMCCDMAIKTTLF